MQTIINMKILKRTKAQIDLVETFGCWVYAMKLNEGLTLREKMKKSKANFVFYYHMLN